MKVLVLSPHFDDAPLSLGQSMLNGALSSHSVSVGVLFSRTNWTQFFHPTRGRWPLVTAIRLAEEGVTSVRFRYRVRLGGFEEVVLRTGDLNSENFLRRVDDIGEHPLTDGIETRIRRWAENADAIVAPLSVGNHVDHQITTEAARRLLAAGRQVVFYEDRPYAAWADPSEPARVAALIDERLVRRAVSGPITADKHRKLVYPSQMTDDFKVAVAVDESGDATEAVWCLPDAPWPPES